MNGTELLKTWVEISRKAAKHNYDVFRGLTDRKKTRLWAVVKSNAYGHGLFSYAKIANKLGVDGFCVDSILEGLALRKEGIRRPVLILGPTMPAQLPAAEKSKVAISASCMEDLIALSKLKEIPEFHLKLDTGMHRRGFYPENLRAVIKFLKSKPKLAAKLTGIFTHFASAKDINYPTYTDMQLAQFKKGTELMKKAGFNLLEHAAATGGALIDKKYHLDAVRVGIGLYGLWPSKELEVQLADKIKLKPILGWRAYVTEVKKMKKKDFVGYDLTERLLRNTEAAIVPVGYWHGFPRALSSVGEVLIRGCRAKVLGRVSMDLLVVDVTGIGAKVHDMVTLIGRGGKEEITVMRLAELAQTSHYEYVTRLNPLMERREIQ
jgi:alanine racemase